MRKRLIPVLALIATSISPVVLASGPAVAAAPVTCQGQAVTITGRPGVYLAGTEGPDVIVSNGAAQVDAEGGDDTICMTGDIGDGDGYGVEGVEAGDGDDSVVVTATRFGTAEPADTSAGLGAGDDTYVGNSGGDDVTADDVQQPEGADQGTDTVTTNGGIDSVLTGTAGQPDADVVSLGSGRDELSLAGMPTDGLTLSGGTSSARLGAGDVFMPVGDEPSVWSLDAGTGTVVVDGHRVVTTGFEGWSLALLTHGTVTFQGGPEDDVLDAVTDPSGGDVTTDRVTAHLGAGDDIAAVGTDAEVYAGTGHDSLRIGPLRSGDGTAGPSALDLAAGTATVRGFHVGFHDVEQVTFDTAGSTDVRGTPGDDHVVVDGGCGLAADLGAGDDRFTFTGRCSKVARVDGGSGNDALFVSSPRTRVDGGPGDDRIDGQQPGYAFAHHNVEHGGRGNDRLVGGTGPDVLAGGPGTDRADGRAGKDTCDAEKRVSCERTP